MTTTEFMYKNTEPTLHCQTGYCSLIYLLQTTLHPPYLND